MKKGQKPRTPEERITYFIARGNEIHDFKYDYTLLSTQNYINYSSKVPIICKEHGVFLQNSNSHLNCKAGCPECGITIMRQQSSRRKTTTTFIEQSKQIYGDIYTYENTIYANICSPVIITCKEHGAFKVANAKKHLYNFQGCPTCCRYMSHPERIIYNTLTADNIEFKREYKFDDCVSPLTQKQLRFDFYIPLYNTLLEYHGEQHFTKNDFMHPGDRFERYKLYDQIKTEYAAHKGIQLIVITQRDLYNIGFVLNKIKHN